MTQRVFSEKFKVYQQVTDICHPSIEELQMIQSVLLHSERPELYFLADNERVPREFKFIGDLPNEMPQHLHIAVNSDPNERENCLIIYASYNRRFPKGAKRLFSNVAESDFKGHIHCRIGGWPDIEGGSLGLAHVPYAFKVCFFKEMKRLGYKRVLYLDSSVLPIVSLNQIFKIIEERGYFVVENGHSVGDVCHFATVAWAFHLTLAELTTMCSCQAGLFGVDFTDDRACQLIDAWYEAAKDPFAFYSPRSDQTALSILLYQLNMRNWMSGNILNAPDGTPDRGLLRVEREFVK